MQEKCRHLVESVDTLQLVLHIFQLMLGLCTSCSSSALRAWPLQLVADVGSKCLSSAARALHFYVFELYNSCSSSALCARPRQQVFELYSSCKCLSSATCAQVLHFMVDFGNLCLSLSARSSCSNRDFVARYCRTPSGLLGVACRCSFPSTDGEQEAIVDVHGVFTVCATELRDCFAAVELGYLVTAELDCLASAELCRCQAGLLGCYRARLLYCCQGGALL
ncbi:hypothetical protein SLEP1_g49273 [Rubroshorea leprosula]|uniref:Secreted protein n=1 Tax=Rubroshorea leprosula TaxID=152421 RepID=A0AAV5LWA3_9ROSI|nr:hypothetical protein SLEP1_g49273 [Rubroshorea leprosula]